MSVTRIVRCKEDHELMYRIGRETYPSGEPIYLCPHCLTTYLVRETDTNGMKKIDYAFDPFIIRRICGI